MPLLDPDILCPVKRRRGPKPVSVRTQFAATLWLDGQPLCQGGRVMWHHHDRIVEIGSRELDAATRALTSLQRHEKAARRHCADFDSWHRTRLEQLQLARTLVAIRAPDLETLVSPSRRRNPVALQRLAQLLAVEACVEALPVSPARALFEARPHSQLAVQSILRDENQPLAARALAALISGAAQPLDALPGNPYLRRVARYGVRLGFPVAPALCVALLENNVPDLENYVQRIQQSLEGRELFRFDANQLLNLQRVKRDSVEIASWAEAALRIPDPFVSLVFAPVAPKRLDLEAERLASQAWNELRSRFNASLRLELEKIAHHDNPGNLDHVAALLDHLISSPTRSLGDAKIERNRVPRRHERDAPPFETSINEAAADVLEILQIVTDAPNPGVLLQLLHQAIQKFDDCSDAINLPPAIWAVRWRSYISGQHYQLKSLLDLAFKFGVESTRRALELGCWEELTRRPKLKPDLLPLTLDLVAWSPEKTRQTINYMGRLGRYWKGITEAQVALSPIRKALGDTEPAERALWLTNILWAMERSRRGVCVELPALAEFVPCMRRNAITDNDDFPVHALVESALALLRSANETDGVDIHQRFETVAGRLKRRFELEKKGNFSYDNIGILVALSARLADDEAKFRGMVASGWRYLGSYVEIEWDLVKRGAKLARQLPQLEATLAGNFVRSAKRCLELLEKLGPLDHFESIRSPLEIWHRHEAVPLDVQWQYLNLDASLHPWAIRFAAAKRELEEAPEPPTILFKILAQPQKIAAEIQALEQHDDLAPNLAKRLENLRVRLAKKDQLEAMAHHQLRESLQNAVFEAELKVAERVVESCYRIRLERLGAPENIPLDADLLNAALFSTDIESNRKWLREIISAHCENRVGWRLEIQGNKRWLQARCERGLQQTQWLSESPQQFTVGNQHIELRLENNPLQILQMGNYFDTCLSYGGCNAYSSVANAVELNKRVVFARDAKGRVVGRQLLALSTEGKLVGFHVYVSIDKQHADKLRDAFGAYARDFAARCNIELADTGEVERLFVADWYDDGTINWSDLDWVEPQPKKKKLKKEVL